MRRWTLGAAALIWLSLAACSAQTPHVSADYPVYASVEELVAASDLVVTGSVGEVVGRQTEGSRGGSVGNPMVFYDFRVAEVLKGQSPLEMVVGYVDLDKISMDEVSAVTAGQELMFFLRCLPDEQSPEIDVVGDFCIPLSADNGVFDVEGDTATARSELLVAVYEAQATVPVRADALRLPVAALASSVRKFAAGPS